MSSVLVGHVLYLNLPPHQKLVLVALAENADDRGLCWPGQELTGIRSSLSTRRLRDHLAWLKTMGWMAQLKDGRGRSGQPEYLLDVDRITAAADQRRQEIQESKAQRRAEKPDATVRIYMEATPEKPDVSDTKSDDIDQKPDVSDTKPDAGVLQNRQEPSAEPPKNRQGGVRSKPSDPAFESLVGEVWQGLKVRRKGIAYPKRKREDQAIRNMIRAGHDPPKILACYDEERSDPWWQGRTVYMTTIESKIPEWVPKGERSNGRYQTTTLQRPGAHRAVPSADRGVSRSSGAAAPAAASVSDWGFSD